MKNKHNSLRVVIFNPLSIRYSSRFTNTPFSSFAMASEVIESEANFLDEYHDALGNFLVALLLYISFVIVLTDIGFSFNNSTGLQLMLKCRSC